MVALAVAGYLAFCREARKKTSLWHSRNHCRTTGTMESVLIFSGEIKPSNIISHLIVFMFHLMDDVFLEHE